MEKTKGLQDKVCVAVRVRPLSQKEQREGATSVVRTDGPQQLTLQREKQEPIKYVFDHVFPPETSQAQVFQSIGQPLLDQAFGGYNCTVFAYGQTGSGKTHTMMNHSAAGDQQGIVPRFSAELFSRIAQVQAAAPHRKFLICCSFLEIYNEILYDLLIPNRTKASVGLEIREQKGLGIYVKDLTEIVVDSPEKLLGLVRQGFESRATAATKMNQASSRSHCILTLKMFQKDEADASKNTHSTMNLVDLAGSERAKDTGAEGELLKEGANINKSLAALGNVINALSSQATGQKKTFVPYRNSKLTRVLQESLGGNSFCTMLSNASPASVNAEETLSTLTYAKRAKVIRIKAVKNEERAQVAKLNDEVENLREKLLQQTAQGPDGLPADVAAAERRNLEEKYDRQIEELEGFIKQTWEDKQKLSEQHEAERGRLQEEARRREEQQLLQRRRRLELLEEKGDLMASLRELVALSGELCGPWSERLGQAQSLEQQLRAQVLAVRLYRDSTKQDLQCWWDAHEEPQVAQQHLQQAAAKLASLRRELDALRSLEERLSALLAGVVPEVERALALCKPGEEEAEICTLVSRQLQAYRLQIRRFLVSSRAELVIEDGAAAGWGDALGAGAAAKATSKAEDFPDVLPMPLGLSSGALEDGCLAASSNAAAASCGRLLHREGAFGGWCAGKDSAGEYLEVSLPSERFISGISTQGRAPLTGAWQQTRELLRHVLEDRPLPSGDPLPSADRVFMRPPVRFFHDVVSSLVRGFGILPGALPEEDLDFGRLETKESKVAFFEKLIRHASNAEGVERFELSAADILKGENTCESGRLLQLLALQALGRGSAAGGSLADGRPQWTTRYTLERRSGDSWEPVCCEDGKARVFDGNVDAVSVASSVFTPFRARGLRIRPVEWHLHPALRAELFGSERPSPGACDGLGERLEKLAAAIDRLKRRTEERQLEGQRAAQAEKDKQKWQAERAELRHEEVAKRLKEAEADLEELRRAKSAGEERLAVAEAGRLEMQVERDKAKACIEQLQTDLRRQSEAHAASEQSVAALRRENDELRERIADMTEQIQVLIDERNSAQVREEDLFDQILAMEECLVDTTEGYLTDKLLEMEAQVASLMKQMDVERTRHAEAEAQWLRQPKDASSPRPPWPGPAPSNGYGPPSAGVSPRLPLPGVGAAGAGTVAATRRLRTMQTEEYSDDFSGDSDDCRATPRQVDESLPPTPAAGSGSQAAKLLR